MKPVPAHGFISHAVLEKSETEERLALSFHKLETNPNDYEALTDIGHAYNVMEQDELAFEYIEKALSIKEHPITWFNYALMLRQCGRHAEAFPFVEKAHNEWPWNMFMGHVYAEELIRQGKWLEAWPLCSRYRPTKNSCAPPGVEEWKGQDISGKRLMVVSEGGRGDSIWLYRFLPKLKELGARVRFFTTPELAALFNENRIIDYDKDEILYDLEHPYDYWVSIFELLQWLKVTEPYWPGVYIKANPDKVLFPIKPSPRVGLCWSAGERLDVRKHRSLSDEQARELLELSEVNWMNLQHGAVPPTKWLAPFKAEDWSETAAKVELCDLVITVDTAMVHLAGAMGKPTWLLLGGYEDCKWMTGDLTGWYPSVRIFRNDSFGFDGLLPKVTEALDNYSRTGVQS